MRRRHPHSRRRYLATAGTVCAFALAGCLVERDEGYEPEPEPVEEHTPIGHRLPSLPVPEFADEYEAGLDAGIDAGIDAEVTDRETFGTALEERGLDVERLERGRRHLLLAYVEETPETGVLREMGYVAGAYVPYVLASDEPATLDATVLEDGGTDFGRFTAYVNWVRSLEAGDEPLAAYGERVFETLKTSR